MISFRTEIGVTPKPMITADGGIVMLGSCFTDNVGARLAADGFTVTHNPLGPLYNPASIAAVIELAARSETYTGCDMMTDAEGRVHCLDFASRYQADTEAELRELIDVDFGELHRALRQARTVIVTLGTAYAFSRVDTGAVVGNCHKFPAETFSRRRMSVDECVEALRRIVAATPTDVECIIFTVSPIRHTADGLHGNQLSKATLLMAIDRLQAEMPAVEYFPAYEIMLDDLRDYRFYAADMKHPTDVAIEYIYDAFRRTYMDERTIARANQRHKDTLRQAHRQIIKQ